MTDNEIIKALECCTGQHGRCISCPFSKEGTVCREMKDSYVRDFINRQKADIERLEKDLMKCKLEKEMLYHVGKEIEAVAIKEFAERLKESLNGKTDPIDDYDIDELVKEITEVQE